MHILLLEKGYADSAWCRALEQSLVAELRKRREEYATVFDADGVTGGDTVFVIGSVFGWLGDTVRRCNNAGVVPILLCTGPKQIPGGRYHCVSSDISGSMGMLTASAKLHYGPRLALYGINPDSVGDQAKLDAYLQENPHPETVFENSASLAECYGHFAPLAGSFDAVLCANGFAAVSLVKRLQTDAPEILDRLRVISCAQSLLTHYCGDRITAVDMNFSAFGKTALGLADMVRKQPHIWQLTATVKWSVEDAQLQLPAIREDIPEQQRASFYRDTELQQMMRVENLLGACDDTDRLLLPMLLEGQSYGAMAEVCFLTEGAVKYRVKNMRTLCDCPDRESLENLLRLYIDN
jgi:hypothetical protein